MDPSLTRILRSWIDENYPALLAFYEDLHQHPELSGSEVRTADALARELKKHGFSVSTGIGGHGVVGVLENGPGAVVLLRAEMDALPIEEKTGLPYASRRKVRTPNGVTVGVSHACGHDLHMAVLLGAGGALARFRSAWSGTLLCVGQPSEEATSGARAMIQEGLYERFPRPHYAFALHAGPGIPLGSVGYQEKLVSAGSRSLDLVIRGLGGHAAYPDAARDPVVLAAQVVLALQTIRSRELSPLEFGVVTVGAIHGGVKHNAIPDEVLLRLNFRFFTQETRDRILDSIQRIARGLAMSAGMPGDRLPIIRHISDGAPPLENDPETTVRIVDALRGALGDERVIEIPPLAGSEDFGYFRGGDPPVRLCYMRLGVDTPETQKENAPYLHSPLFAPPPEAIRVGAHAMAVTAISLLQPEA
ncbi:MAG: amidohydrolase [Methanomicrobiales archaeon]|nr:amidohydrolase [Methanomicrobiales archaeon]MDI6875306.1 amidohydrolase [Methanomicrobiales archaeon]